MEKKDEQRNEAAMMAEIHRLLALADGKDLRIVYYYLKNLEAQK